MIKTIGIIGAGQMGNGIAHVAALSGVDVRLLDVDTAALDAVRPNRRTTWTARSAVR